MLDGYPLLYHIAGKAMPSEKDDPQPSQVQKDLLAKFKKGNKVFLVHPKGGLKLTSGPPDHRILHEMKNGEELEIVRDPFHHTKRDDVILIPVKIESVTVPLWSIHLMTSEDFKSPERKCICPPENFRFPGIGCKCGGT